MSQSPSRTDNSSIGGIILLVILLIAAFIIGGFVLTVFGIFIHWMIRIVVGVAIIYLIIRLLRG